MSVKISSLELENVKRIKAVQLTPTKDGLTVIGGRNGQGKTSVLDAIMWALGGNRYKPDAPDRVGAATPAKIRVEMSNGLVVERRGKTGALHVTDESGKKAGQALLDEFVSQLALDLPKFMHGSDAEKATALLHTLGIDGELSRLDARIKGAYEERRDLARDARAARARADGMPFHEDAPDELVDVAALVARQQEIVRRNAGNEAARERAKLLDRAAAEARERADAARREYARAMDALKAAEEEAEAAHADSDGLADAPTDEVDAAIAGAEATNSMVRENEARARAMGEAEEAERAAGDASDRLESLRQARTALLDGAPLPLPGLSIDDDGRLTYRGHTWGDMSGSEQLRVATAIVRATKPECGFVLVDELEQMDPQTLAEFGAWAESEGLQVIGTRVATDETCTVVIEDGRVAQADGEEDAGEGAGRWKSL